MIRAPQRPARPAQVTSAEVAAKLIDDLSRAMDDLLLLMKRETELVRAGKLRAAGELAAEKEDKASDYTRLMLVARDEARTLAVYDPDAVAELKRRHELFRAEIQVNLAVLATAREVAEGLMRSVAREVSQTIAPPVYGRQGGTVSASEAGRGIAVNQSL